MEARQTGWRRGGGEREDEGETRAGGEQGQERGQERRVEGGERRAEGSGEWREGCSSVGVEGRREGEGERERMWCVVCGVWCVVCVGEWESGSVGVGVRVTRSGSGVYGWMGVDSGWSQLRRGGGCTDGQTGPGRSKLTAIMYCTRYVLLCRYVRSVSTYTYVVLRPRPRPRVLLAAGWPGGYYTIVQRILLASHGLGARVTSSRQMYRVLCIVRTYAVVQ